MKKINKASETDKLRQKAEKMLTQNKIQSKATYTDDEILKRLNELELYHIELELQNEELNKVTEQLEIKSRKYTKLYDYAPMAYFTLNRQGEIVELNNSAANLLGKDHSKLMNSRIGFFVSNDTKTIFNLFLDSAFATGERESCEITLLLDDKSLVYVCLTGLVSRNEEDCFVTMVDITERIKSVEDLRQSEERYKSIFQNNHSAMLLINPETGEIKDANQSACNYYGWTHNELCNMIISEINTLSIEGIKAEMQKAIDEERKYFVFKHRLASKEIRDVEVYSGPIQYGDEKLLYSIVNDITEEKKTEEKLRKSEESYRNLVESINDVVYEISNEGIIKYVSPSVYRILGYLAEEVIGTNIISYIYADDKSMIIERIAKIYEKDYSFLEYRYITKNGEIRWVRSSTNAIIEDGKMTGARGTLTDITERKLAEEAVKISEEKYSKAFLTSPYAITITNAEDGKIIEVNDAFTTISGYTKEEALKDSSIGLNLWVDIDERKKVLSQLKEGKEIVGLECLFRNKNGEDIAAIFSASIIYLANKPYILSSINDITKQKKTENALRESETLYRAILNASPDNITISDLNGSIEFVSAKALSMFGYDQIEQLINRNIGEFLVPDDWEKAQNVILNMHQGVFLGPGEYRGVKNNGNIIDIEVNAEFVRNQEGVPQKMVFVIRDITERVLSKNMLIEDQKIFRILNDLMSDYIFKLSHQEDGNFKMSIIAGNYQKATGRSLEDINTPSDWHKTIHPEDLSVLNANFKQVLEQKKSVIFECRSFTEDGKLRWLNVIATPEIDDQTQEIIGIYGSVSNITEKKLSIQNLMESELKYRNIFENILDVYYEATIDGTLLDISPSIEIVSKGQFTRNELIGTSIANYYSDPEDRNRFFSDLKKTGKVTDYEISFKNKDGSIIPITVTTGLFYDAAGNPEKIIGSMRDITERKLAEVALEESELNYRTLANSGQALVWTATPDKKCNFFNQVWLNFTGRTLMQELGDGWAEGVHPDDLDRCFSIYSSSFDARISFSMDYRLRYHDGTYHWLQDNGKPRYNSQGDFIGYIGHCLDISDRIYAENDIKDKSAVLSNLIINMQEGILLEDINRKILLCNELFCKMFGIGAPPEALLGADCSDSAEQNKIYFKNPEKFVTDIQLILENRNAVFNEELELKDGRFFERDYIPTYIENEYSGHLWKYRDITNRKKAELLLKQSEEKYRKDLTLLNSIIESPIDIIIFSLDVNYCYTAFSKFHERTMKKIWGVDIHIGMNMLDIISNPDDRKKAKNNFNRSLSGEYFVLTEEYGDEKLSRSYYENYYSAVKNAENEIIGLSVFVIDVSERTQALIKLKESEERFRQVVTLSEEVVWEIDSSGLYTYVSPIALQIYGYTAEQLVDKMYFYDLCPASEREQFKIEVLESFKKKESFHDFINLIVRSDGRIITVSSNAQPMLDEKGLLLGYRGVDADITERLIAENKIIESEKKYRNLVNSQTSYLLKIDLNGNHNYWNNKYEEEFGWIYEEEGIGNGIALKSIADYHQQRFIETVEQCINNPAEIFKIELDKPVKDGSVITTLWEFIALTDNHNIPFEIQCTGIDITDRKLMEMELRDSNERASVIMNSIDAFIYIADMQTHELIFINEYGKKAWGEDITGKQCFSTLQGLNQPCEFCTNNKLLTADGKPKDVYQWEYQNKVNNRWYEIQDRAIYWTDGRVVRLEVAIDITDKKLSTLKILESEEKFRLITEQTNDFIAIADENGVITYASSSSMSIFLLSPEEMHGRNFMEFVDENEITKAISVFNDLLNNKEIVENTEFKLKRADGSLFIGEINGSKLESESQKGILVAIRDITERKNAEIAVSKSEERYRFITERSTDLIFIFRLKPEMGFEYVSPSSERITGYTPEDHYNDSMLGMKLVHPDDVHLLKSLQNGIVSEEVNTLRWIKKDGSIIWTESQNIPIYDVNGELVAIQGKAIDVTERKQSEQIIQTRLRLNEYAQTHSRNEIQQKLLDELELLTTSSIGFFHSVNDDQKSLTLQCWSTNTLENMCKAEGQGQHYGLDKAGIWTDCIHQRKAVIHNDYKSLTHKKGLPQGHAEVIRELVVPVFRNEKIVAIIGIGNKPTNYNENEIEMVSLLSDLAWDITERKGNEENLQKLSLAVEQSPAIIYITNLDGTIDYANPKATEVSGYSNKELVGKNPRIFSSGEKPKEEYIALYQTISSGKEWKGEFHNKKKNGELYWVMASISPVINSNGVISHYIAIEEDITNRKLAEETLKQKEISLNYSQEIAKMGSWEFDLITTKVKWSDNYYRLLGLQPDNKEVSSDFFNSIVYPDDKHLIDENLQEINKYKKATSFDMRIVMPDGQLKWIQNNVVPEFDGDTLITLKGVNIDITEKKLAEDKISNQNEQLNAIISAMPDLIFIIDKEGTYTDFFTSNLENLIIPLDKIIGTNIKSVFDEETATLHIQKIEECIRYKKLVTYEYEVSINNKILYFDARLASLGSDKVLTSVRDITDRKEKETNLRKLSQAIEQSPVTIVITDIKGHVEYVNPAFEISSGYSFEEVKGKTTRILKSGKMDESVYKELWENIPNGKEWHGEWINKRKNGELYWEDVSITPVFSESGEIINYLAVKQDITQKKESEKQILELNENLERKVQERTNELAQTNFILKKEIDNRILADLSLAIEKQRLASIIEGTNVGTWEWNVKTGENIVNERWAEIFGYSLDELFPVTIDSWINFIHPDDKNKTIELIKKHFSGEFNYFDSEFRMKNKNGNWIWVLDRGKISKWDTDGKPLLMSGTLQDITERKMAEEELHWNKSLLELMSNSSPLGFLVVDNRTDDILYFNNRFCQIWGIEHIADQMQRGELKNNDIIPYCLPVLADIPAFAESCKPLQEELNRIVLEDEIAFTDNRTVRRFTTQIRGSNDEYYGRFYIFEDITERKQTEEALKESREQLNLVIKGSNDAPWDWNLLTDNLFYSLKWWEQIGYLPDEIPSDSKLWRNLTHPDDIEYTNTILSNALNSNTESYEAEFRLLHKNGYYVPVLSRGFISRDSDGKAIRVTGTNMDLTERKKAEQAILDSEIRYSTMISNISDVIGIMGADGVMKYKSPNIERYFGWKPKDLIGTDGWLTIHPDDMERIQTEFYHLLQSDNFSKTVEYRYKCKDGSYKPIELTATNLVNDPVINGVLLNYHDTTERKLAEDALKESEKRFSLFMDYLPAVVFLKDHEGKTLFVNKYMDDAFGASAWVGKNMLEVFPGEFGEKLISDDRNSMELGYQKIDESMVQLDGKLHSYETQKFVIDRQGQPPLLGGISLDITERIHAAEIVEQTRKNYETFFNTIDDFLFVLDEQGNIIHTNNTVNERLEYSNEELFGKSVLLVHPEERREEAGRIVGEMLTGTADFCPVPLVTKSGNYIPVETRVKSGFWNGNAVIFGVTKDVSKLQLSEQKFSKAFQSNSALMAISFFESGIFFDINDSFVKTLGYSREEIIGKTAEELNLFNDSEIRNILIADIINKKPVREIEIEVIKKDGSSIFGLFSADLIYIGKDLCLLSVLVDITERKIIEKALKESEARWNFAIEGSGDGLWDWNAQANEVFFSNQWKALLGYTENEIGTGFDEWKKRIHPDDMEKTMVYLNKHLKGITEVYLHEYRLRCKDGSYKWIFDRGKVFERTADGKPLRVIGTCTNISDRKRYEESLRESINKEKELNELKSRFVSMASHEFRTPLASILMSSDILIAYWKRLDELQITEKLNTIKGQVLHLTNVVTDVMQISKIQEGKSVFNPQPSDLIELCRNTILTFNSNNELINKIEFVSKYEKLNMKIDVRLIQQVMNNLISNAIKYSNENPIVKISLYEEKEEILLSIADNGIGIPEDEQKNLFQPFYRASNVTVIQGNGLGLNIVKESMKLHGGSIKFESILGKGTTFVVHFPKVLTI